MSLWFFENDNFAARAAKFADFIGIGLIKIYLIGTIVPVFENSSKVQYPSSSNLLYVYYSIYE